MDKHNQQKAFSVERWPLLANVSALEEVSWFNPHLSPTSIALHDVPLGLPDVVAAEARLARFKPYIQSAFPETQIQGGLIESDCVPILHMQRALAVHEHIHIPGNLFLKKDSHLPIAGSIKARGGIYEVLKYAEKLAIEHGLVNITDDYEQLDSPRFKTFFSQYKLIVGSTGNLGLSIGIMGATLGFHVMVHMSVEAKAWKKALLRQHGVTVIEHASDYGAAVEAGRQSALADPYAYFIDDERSHDLFLGYATAGERLKKQLVESHILVDKHHPLFVYLPCGVGGAPGGITFGLKQAFGDNVHCFFLEPTHSPCMLLGLYTALYDHISVYDIGLDNITMADGLAVARPSGFIARSMRRLIDGCFTVSDTSALTYLALLHQTEKIQLELSAALGIAGVVKLLQASKAYWERIQCSETTLSQAVHVIWATGGGMVPHD